MSAAGWVAPDTIWPHPPKYLSTCNRCIITMSRGREEHPDQQVGQIRNVLASLQGSGNGGYDDTYMWRIGPYIIYNLTFVDL